MSSELTLRWLERIGKGRTIESLISEVYGEAMLYANLLEREVADMLNFYDLATEGLTSLLRTPFDTKKWTLSSLLVEAKMRGLPDDAYRILEDGKDARNELAHRIINEQVVVSRIDKEVLVERIAGLYVRVYSGWKVAVQLKTHYAGKLGITEDRIREQVEKLKEGALKEDANLREILGEDGPPPAS